MTEPDVTLTVTRDAIAEVLVAHLDPILVPASLIADAADAVAAILAAPMPPPPEAGTNDDVREAVLATHRVLGHDYLDVAPPPPPPEGVYEQVGWRWRWLPWDGFPLGRWVYTEIEPDADRMTEGTTRPAAQIEVEPLLRLVPTEPPPPSPMKEPERGDVVSDDYDEGIVLAFTANDKGHRCAVLARDGGGLIVCPLSDITENHGPPEGDTWHGWEVGK